VWGIGRKRSFVHTMSTTGPTFNVRSTMARGVAGTDRAQWMRLPQCLDDWVDESDPVGVIDVFVDALDLRNPGFDGLKWKKFVERAS
jgi:hypothetical protein